MANRYTNLTPSAYTPMTFQEIAAVPGAKRKQHDQLIAAQELIRSGLAKTDPLTVHHERALELKRGIESRLDATATELSEKGINNDMIGKALAMNREYQDLVGPTGEIGQINEAKIYFNKQKDEFLKSAEAQKIGRDRALDLWNTKTKDYTGFDPDRKITNVTPQGVAAHQDYETDLNQANARLGSIATSVRAKGFDIRDSGLGDGSVMVVNKSGAKVYDSNVENINESRRAFKKKWANPLGEGYKYAQDAGLNITDERINQDFNAMIKTSEKDERTESASLHGGAGAGGKDKTPGTPSAITDPVGLEETISDSNIDRVENLGNKVFNIDQIPPKNRYETEADYKKRTAGIKYDPTTKKYRQQVGNKIEELPPALRTQIMDIYNAKKAQGKIAKGDKFTDYNPATIKIIANEMKRLQHINFSNQIIVPDSEENDILASPQLIGKEAVERDKFIQNRLFAALNDDTDKQGNVIFSKNGETVDLQDVDIDSVKLVGHYSPANKLKQFGKGQDNAVSPHMITWKDKNGNQHTGLMPRDSSEMTSPEFTGARIIKKTTDKAVDREGNFTTFNKDMIPELNDADLSIFGINDRGLNGMRVKFNNSKKTYTIELIDKNNKSSKIEADTKRYQDIMYDMFN